MNAETFARLTTAQIARIVGQAGSKVCVFPLKGTRRWFLLEHPDVPQEDFRKAYLAAITRRSLALYRLIFDHGLDTLLTPSFSPDIMARGEGYMQIAAAGLAHLATDPDFLEFYRAYGVRVRFYGDYRRYFESTPHAYLCDLFDALTERTRAHDRRRLLFGLFAHDPLETIADLSIRHHLEHGDVPEKRRLIEMYYGEYVEPVDLFIGFGKLRAFDMPLITTGREDLYFTVTPSPYLTERQLRDILYDHLFARTRTNVDLAPEQLRDALYDNPDAQTQDTRPSGPATWTFIKGFYTANQGRTLGLGRIDAFSGNWHPLPQVDLPADSSG
jgi:tuberculosinol/isotuberculosinol synthase